MKKPIIFLGGLPRSGNTLLSAILNQHPKLYVSPVSILPELFVAIYSAKQKSQHLTISQDLRPLDNVMNNLAQVYYSHIDKPIVIDRFKSWTIPEHMYFMKRHITENPKILFTVRPVLDILASYLNLYSRQPNNLSALDIEMAQYFAFSKEWKPINVARAEWIMRPNAQVDTALYALANLLRPENRQSGHLIDYDTLLSKPREVLAKIETFLGVEPFEYDLTNIQKFHEDFDELAGLDKGTHDVRRKLERATYDKELILPETIKTRYSGLDFWLNER